MSELHNKLYAERWKLDDNYAFINKINLSILFASVFISVIISVLSIFGIFSVSKSFCIILLVYSFVSALLEFFLQKIFKVKSIISAFFGLAAAEGFITLAASSSSVGIYISFSVAPVLATLYYNKKFTLIMDITCYFLMVISLYFKWTNNAAIFVNMQGETGFFKTYIPIIIGFTIEYIILILITLMLTNRNVSVLTQKKQSTCRVKSFFQGNRSKK